MTGVAGLGAVVALLAAGCGPTGAGAGGRRPDPAAGDGARWVAAAGQHTVLAPSGGNWSRRGVLSAGKEGSLAALLFDLKDLPQGAAPTRAVLRLRCETAGGRAKLAVMDVRKGLRVLYYSDGEPIFGITRARVTADKAEMLAEGTNESRGARACGLALAGHPVECSLPSEKYSVGMFRAGRHYGELLEEWNGLLAGSHRRAGSWDEFDVTEAVRGALAGDRRVLLAVRASGGEATWLAGRSESERWAAPQLVVEFEPGTAAAPPPSAPSAPAPLPVPAPVPVQQPAPVVPPASPAPAPPPPAAPPAAQAGRGLLVITSEPSRADIYIDGKCVGTTPSRELELPAGEIRVRIEKAGFRPWERAVTVLEGNVVSVGPELEKDAP
jgi:hypothetical protein